MINTDPHDMRLAARASKYPNSATEREVTKALDKFVFDKVRSYETGVTRSADAFVERLAEPAREAAGIAADLRDDFRRNLVAGELRAIPDVAKRYENLRRSAGSRAAELREAARQARWRADRCEDPYAHYIQLVRTFPTLQGR
jgi:hypothetical protein